MDKQIDGLAPDEWAPSERSVPVFRAEQWQPMETAPKDGFILVYMPQMQMVLDVVFDPDVQKGNIFPDADELDQGDWPWADAFGNAYPTAAFSHWMEHPGDPIPLEEVVAADEADNWKPRGIIHDRARGMKWRS